jgi:signal peptidase I
MPRNQEKQKAEKRETPLETVASFAALAANALFIITFTLQGFAIPTSSMENTLLVGDHVIVDRVTLAPGAFSLLPRHETQRGDIVVFLKPGEPGLYLVKRVIGVPGDRIRLRHGVVYVNGAAQAEPYVIHSGGNYDPYRDEFPVLAATDRDPATPDWRLSLPGHVSDGELLVPPGHYFGMGDNRDVSLDSRYWGFIPRENILGRPLVIYWSFAAPTSEYLSATIPERLHATANMVIHFFDETRWRRTLRIVR